MPNTFGWVLVQRFCFSIEIYGGGVLSLFVGVCMARIIDKPPKVFMRPACSTCGSRVLLVRVFPDKPGYDLHTYECPRCADETTEIVEFVKAEAFC